MSIAKRISFIIPAYLLLTYCLYLFGPYKYALSARVDYYTLTSFILGCCAAIFLGARTVKIPAVGAYSGNPSSRYLRPFLFCLYISIISIVLLILESLANG